MEAIKTTVVAMVSLKLSVAVAFIAAESIFLLILLLYRYIYIFTKMDTTRIPAAKALKSTV